MAVPRDPIDGAGCGRIGSAPAVGRRVIKAATAASMFLAIHLNVPNRAVVGLGNAEPEVDLAQLSQIFNNIYP
jgi:hypothetical protein